MERQIKRLKSLGYSAIETPDPNVIMVNRKLMINVTEKTWQEMGTDLHGTYKDIERFLEQWFVGTGSSFTK